MADALTTLAAVKSYLNLAPSWAASTTWSVGDVVRANGNQYECITAGAGATSGTGPSGTTADITDGSAHWKWVATSRGGFTAAAEDAMLTSMIGAVNDLVAQYCDRAFLSASHTLVTSGRGGITMPLPETPVTAVASVTVGATVIPARASLVSDGYVFDSAEITLCGYAFDRGTKNVQIVYTAGYASIPSDLAFAAIETVASWYKRRTRIDEITQSLGATGTSITYSIAEMPKAARMIVDTYKRMWPRL